MSQMLPSLDFLPRGHENQKQQCGKKEISRRSFVPLSLGADLLLRKLGLHLTGSIALAPHQYQFLQIENSRWEPNYKSLGS